MIGFIVYWARIVRCVLVGGRAWYAWMGSLLLVFTLGVIAWLQQIDQGLTVTAMTDQVSWGFYLANFVYFVGVAAAAVLLVVPAYAFHRKDIKEVVLIGELLAVSAGIVCLTFVAVDVGRPDRLWHLMPGWGIMNLPSSMLAWDVVVFSGYLALNLHIPGYLLYKMYRGETPKPIVYIPLVFLSMFWAVSIHTVTAFLLAGLGARHFWNSAILAPRFLISAGASGPALLILVFVALKGRAGLPVKDSVFEYLKSVLRLTMPINLFLLMCDFFTEFYPGTLHSINGRYLWFGVGPYHMLNKFIWTAVAMDIIATVIFLTPKLRAKTNLLYAGCVMTILGIWIEKGMGLLLPGFIPTPLGEFVEYAPSATEIFVCFGVLSLGIMAFSAMVRVAIAIQSGELHIKLKPGEVAKAPPPVEHDHHDGVEAEAH